MPRYKISDRIPQHIADRGKQLLDVAYPFHLLFPARFGTDERFAAELKKRLRAIPYPYLLVRASASHAASTYDVLKKHRVLEALFDPKLVARLRLWAESYEEWFQTRQLFQANTEAGKAFRKFHVPVAKELARHANALHRLIDHSKLSEQWIGSYVRTVEERLLLEFVLLRSRVAKKQQSDTEATRDIVQLMYSGILDSLVSVSVRKRALAYHLTSILLSPNCLATKALSPTPEGVRKLIERNPVKLNK